MHTANPDKLPDATTKRGGCRSSFAARGGMECCDKCGRGQSVTGDLATGGGQKNGDPPPTAVWVVGLMRHRLGGPAWLTWSFDVDG
jgi:hypothetical protein